MIVKQLSVFLENKSGRLAEVFSTLSSENINITAVSIADTSEFGILRLLVSDPEESRKILKKREFTVNISEVISIMTPTKAESFSKVLGILSNDNISVEYFYAFSLGKKAVMVIKTDNNHESLKILQEHEMELLKASDLYKL